MSIQKESIKVIRIKEIKYEGVEWSDQTQECDMGWALVNTVMDPRNPLNACKFSKGLETVTFSRTTVLHGLSSLLNKQILRVD
jgi:hypothetical protein